MKPAAAPGTIVVLGAALSGGRRLIRQRMKPAAALGTIVVLGAALSGCGADSGPEPTGRPALPPASAAAPASETNDTPSPDEPGTNGVAGGGGDPPSLAEPGTNSASGGRDDTPASPSGIVYHVVKGARFFDILVARIGNREHVVLGETDDMCLDLPDQRDFDGDGNRDALVFRSPRCRGDAAPGLLFFVSGDIGFRRSNSFPGNRPRVERRNGDWSVVTGDTRHVLRDGRAVPVE